MDSPVLLQTEKLSIGYAFGRTPHVLFNQLDLELRQGQLVCFMGPNGVGKSTLIRTLANLQPALGGKIIIAEQTSYHQSYPTKLSVVLTDKVSTNNMTARELISFGRYPYLNWNLTLDHEDGLMIEKAIALTNIQSLISKKLYELSDGQLQMVMIARALAQHTPIILLDEPTAHLDLNNRVEIMNLLRALARQENKAILVSTHELDLALQTADHIWLAGLDKKMLTGVPEDLVLNGSFDDIFQFKGFDLKTGKVFHESFRKFSIHLKGDGHAFLWTKNALERAGYTVSMAPEDPILIVVKINNRTEWNFQQNIFSSLGVLLQHLEKLSE